MIFTSLILKLLLVVFLCLTQRFTPLLNLINRALSLIHVMFDGLKVTVHIFMAALDL